MRCFAFKFCAMFHKQLNSFLLKIKKEEQHNYGLLLSQSSEVSAVGAVGTSITCNKN